MPNVFGGYIRGVGDLLNDAHTLTAPDFRTPSDFSDNYTQYVKKAEVYFENVEKRLKDFLELNDKENVLLVKNELVNNKRVLKKADLGAWSEDIFKEVIKLKKHRNHINTLLLRTMCDLYEGLVDYNEDKLKEANHCLEYIPTQEFLDDARQENLIAPMAKIWDNGYVSGAALSASDIEKLKERDMISVDDKNRVYLSNKGLHIYRTCFASKK